MATWRYLTRDEFESVEGPTAGDSIEEPSELESTGVYTCLDGKVAKEGLTLVIPAGHLVIPLHRKEAAPWCYDSVGVRVSLFGASVEIKDGTPIAVVAPDRLEALRAK